MWEAYTPQNIQITVESTGSAKYISRNPMKPPTETGADSDYVLEFTMSGPGRDKVFRCAEETNYLKGDFNYNIFCGQYWQKTLTYADQGRHEEPATISQKTSASRKSQIFQVLPNTIEYGRKLQFLHRLDKLGLRLS